MDKDSTTNPSEQKQAAKVQQLSTGKKEEKPSAQTLARRLAHRIIGNTAKAKHLPAFPERWHVYLTEDMEPMVLQEIENRQVRPLKDTVARYTIDKYADGLEDPLYRSWFNLSQSGFEEALHKVKAYSNPIPEPSAVGYKSSKTLCFQRLPFDLETGPTPLFDELIARMTEPEAVRCFIGSLFFRDSYLQQWLWIQGEGGDGKGCLVRVLMKAMGRAFVALRAPKTNGDNFWTARLVNKRLGAITECRSGAVAQSDIIKTVTGGDPLDIERKGKDSYTYNHSCKLIFTANTEPKLTAEKNSSRRAIYTKIKSPAEIDQAADPLYEDKLWGEAGYFISNCIEEYREKYPNHGPIRTLGDSYKEAVIQSEIPFENIIEKKFMVGEPTYNMTRGEFFDLVKGEFSNNEIARFKKYLEDNHSVKIKQVQETVAGVKRREKHYFGIQARSSSDRNKSVQ